MTERRLPTEHAVMQKEILPMGGGYRSELGLDGHLNIFNPEGQRVIAGAAGRIELSDGRSVSTHEGERSIKTTESGGVRLEVSKDGLTLGWNIIPDTDQPGLRMTQDVSAENGEALAIDRFVVMDVEEGLDKTPANQLDTVYYGYQSWDITQRGKLSKLRYTPDRDRKQPIERISDTSVPMSAFTSLEAENGQSMFVGFTSTDTMHNVIELDATETAHRITAWNDGEGVKGLQSSEEMLVLFDMPEKDALAIYKKDLLANRGLTDRKPLLEAPDYHCTWYEDRLDVTRESNLAQVDLLTEFPTVEAFISDDGWEEGLRPGDWVPNEKFRSPELNERLQGISMAEIMQDSDHMALINAEMKEYTDTIHSKGKKAYLWLAPGAVHSASATFQEHPDWMVKDEAGQALDMLNNPDWDENKIYALDITNPEVQEHVDQIFDRIFNVWEFDGAKIDFLRVLYDKGQRMDPSVTSMEAGNMFMKRIWDKAREHEGDEKLVIGCGVPLIPAVGFVDSVRISPDSHPKMVVLDGLRGQTFNNRMNGHRSSTYEGLFELDHDPMLLRRDKTELTSHQRNAAIVTTAIFGGVNGIGDNLARMYAEDPEQYGHTREVMQRLALSNGVSPARPVEFDHEGNPSLATMWLDEGDRQWMVAATFNHTGQTESVLDTRRLGLDPQREYSVFDTVNREHIGSINGESLPLPTEPGGANLVCIFESGTVVPAYQDFLGRTVHNAQIAS
jgi:hypothetical protein